MENINSAVETLMQGANTLFILIGAILVLAMHAGFAFLEVGTVRKKNQVNALVKIMTDFGFSTLAYFFIGSGSLMTSPSSTAHQRWQKPTAMLW